MNRIILTLCVALIAVNAQAQQNDGQTSNRQNNKNQKKEKVEQSKEDLYKQQAESFVESFELSTETGAKFINLYIEWQNARMNITDKYGYAQSAGADVNFKKITPEEAEKLLNDDFDRLAKQAQVDKEYYVKFQEFVTPGHAAQVVIQQRNSSAGRMAQFRNMSGGRGMGGMNMGGMF